MYTFIKGVKKICLLSELSKNKSS